MNLNRLQVTKNIFLILSLSILAISGLKAQGDAICKDGDCSDAVFSIPFDEPLQANSDGQRTERFKEAYMAFQNIKNGYAGSIEWKTKYEASQLGGQSCLRHYQLESHFAHEYMQNPEFKKFVDSKRSDSGNYLEYGFNNSRKGVNLATRMQSKCPDQLKEIEKKSGPSQKDTPVIYQKLGQELGYFDEKGNQLKPIEENTLLTDLAKLSKKKQVAALKDKVNQLPLGPETKSKIDNLKTGLSKARPKLGLFKKALGLMNSKFATFLPGPVGLIGKIKTGLGILGALKNFKSKFPFPGLLSKIGNLFKKGEGLRDKAKNLISKSNKLKDKFDKLADKGKALEKELDKRTDKIKELQDKLSKLQSKKDDLVDKLANKPKKILDELKIGVNDITKQSKDLIKDVAKENKLKDKLLKEIDDLLKEKDKVSKELEDLEKENDDLSKEQEELDKETKDVEEEVEKIKKDEAKAEELKKDLEDLKPEEDIEKEISDCESDLKKLLDKINGVEEFQEKVKEKKKNIFAKPAKLLAKLSKLKIFQNKLKLGKNGIPLADKALAKVDKLIAKADNINTAVEAITGKETKLGETISNIDGKITSINDLYQAKIANIDDLKSKLLELVSEKSGLKEKLEKGVKDIEQMDGIVKDFIKKYNLFDEESDCLSKEDIDTKTEEVESEQEEVDEEIDEVEKEIEEAEKDEEALEKETEEESERIEEAVKEIEKLKLEELAIKKEYGTDIKLEPVTIEQWSETFEVERPYWDAVFHPDDEVVEGFKGRYFEVRLKNAEKNVKLLFGPGEYSKSKSDFRKSYGSTIGAFVTEALHTMKQADQGEVKLFIQGSADITGHKTFSGKQKDDFLFEQISVLPQKNSVDNFASQPITKSIPKRGFKNDDLPDLRAQYLKQMISIYSKKFDPIILEGAVKKFKGEEERNAIIYLFFPESILTTE